MFVRLSKYRKIIAEAATLADQLTQEMARTAKAERQKGEWRALAHDQKAQIASLIFELQVARMSNAKASSPQFSQEQIRTLITLCHPDKHGGKESAKTMTQHLLQMRK